MDKDPKGVVKENRAKPEWLFLTKFRLSPVTGSFGISRA